MSKSKNGILLYRATRDGFDAKDFHSRCDGKAKTITIIKDDLNCVFGGYASASWNSSNQYINDPNAFLFSLRRDGKSYNDKFTIKNAAYALYGSSSDGPIFGQFSHLLCPFDNQSNDPLFGCILFDFGYSYNLPDRYFLAGKWKTTEIEVYQIVDKI